MKKLVLTLTVSVACVAAFAQGKIGFQTDSLHLAYYDSTAGSLAGTAVSSANQPPGDGMVADLYMGTSSTALSLYATSTFQAVPGKWNLVNVSADGAHAYGGAGPGPSVPAGPVFVMAQIRDTNGVALTTLNSTQLQGGALAIGAAQGNSYIGWSQEFQFTLGSSVTYPAMYSSANWTAGTFDLSGSAGPGAKGAVPVSAVPEPASFALAGLGAAAMVIFRRRK